MLKEQINKLDQIIEKVDSHYKSIVELYASAKLLIQEINLEIDKKEEEAQFWEMIKDLSKWIENGKQIIKKFDSINIMQVQKQLLNEQSINLSQSQEMLNALNQFIQNLEFLSGTKQIDLDYVNYPENQVAFSKEYRVSQINSVNKCARIQGFQRVRGDGNCFYTSFFYQYLKIIIESQNKSLVDDFIKQIKEINLTLFFNKQSLIKRIQEISIKWYFQEIIFELVKHPQKLLLYFSKSNKIFYVCAIIIFRNYVHYVYDQNQLMLSDFLHEDFFDEIITWQQECNTNQAIIQILCKELNLQVHLYFFNQNSVDVQIYNQQKNLNQINLLFRPGHYQIAICDYQNYNRLQS